jgi:hypothetical protein
MLDNPHDVADESAPKSRIVKDAAYYREWRARDKARKVAQPKEPVATESTPVEAASEPD